MNLRVLRDVCEVQEELGREYSQFGREEVQSPNAPTAVNYVFSNPTLGRIVKLWEDRFAIIFTRYGTFERFKAEVIERAQRFCEMFRIERLTRIGLRYINNIPIPGNGGTFPLSRYVRLYINLARIESAQMKQFAMEVLMQKDDCLLNARSAFLIQPPSSQERIYVLDFDASVVGEINLKELHVLLDRLHYHVQVEFLNHVTEEYKQQMRREK
jgi:uncharacterized protein (TIGR04255 family)